MGENCNHKCHYKCKLCGIFINKKMKIFHCEECKKCYVGEKKYFQHCFSCQMCIGRATEHKCLEEKIQNRNCSICLDSLISDDSKNACILSCGHSFHVECISDWIGYGHDKCPYKCEESFQMKEENSESWISSFFKKKWLPKNYFGTKTNEIIEFNVPQVEELPLHILDRVKT